MGIRLTGHDYYSSVIARRRQHTYDIYIYVVLPRRYTGSDTEGYSCSVFNGWLLYCNQQKVHWKQYGVLGDTTAVHELGDDSKR